MSVQREVHVGNWYRRRKDLSFGPSLRTVYAYDGRIVLYYEFFGDHVRRYFGSCTDRTLLAWGKDITEDEAMKVFPDLALRLLADDDTRPARREEIKQLATAVLDKMQREDAEFDGRFEHIVLVLTIADELGCLKLQEAANGTQEGNQELHSGG